MEGNPAITRKMNHLVSGGYLGLFVLVKMLGFWPDKGGVVAMWAHRWEGSWGAVFLFFSFFVEEGMVAVTGPGPHYDVTLESSTNKIGIDGQPEKVTTSSMKPVTRLIINR